MMMQHHVKDMYYIPYSNGHNYQNIKINMLLEDEKVYGDLLSMYSSTDDVIREFFRTDLETRK